MKRIAIITGVTSFLGKSTARFLLQSDFLVFGIVRPDSKNKDSLKDLKDLKLIEIDFDRISSSDFESLNDSTIKAIHEITKKETDITFIHFGWGSTLDRNNFMAQMLNVDYSMKVLEFAKLLKAKRFIFAGSQAEYSDSAYGLAKLRFSKNAVKYLSDSDMRFIHLRIFSIYGKEDRETSLIKTLVKACKANKDFDLSSCEFKWNFLFINDFICIIYKLIDKNVSSGDYDIASSDTRLLKDFCLEVKEVLNSSSVLNFGAREDSDEKFAIPNIKKLVSAIGSFGFTKFRDGILSI